MDSQELFELLWREPVGFYQLNSLGNINHLDFKTLDCRLECINGCFKRVELTLERLDGTFLLSRVTGF